MGFEQLCKANSKGGDPRIYDAMLKILIGGDPEVASFSEEIVRVYDAKLLEKITSGSTNPSSDDA